MFKYERKKNPARVRAGKQAQQRRRAGMSDEQYRAVQRALRERAIAKHPDMARRGAQQANAAQLREWGTDGYSRQRQNAYASCVEAHGERITKEAIKRAHIQGRLKRLHNPTPSEAALRQTLADFGYQVRCTQDPFDYSAWRGGQSHHDIGPIDVFAEAQVGPYYCDILLPNQRTVIEVYGGIHSITQKRDELRRSFLEAQGLIVIVLHDTPTQPLDRATIQQALEQYNLIERIRSYL
jgi:very-short-patch-repair endonuclease